MFIRSALLLLATLAAPAFASETITLKTCEISGEVRLQGPTKIECEGTLRFADDAVLVRNGFTLAIFAQRFDGGKAQITCFDAKSTNEDGKCYSMYFYTFTLAGQPTIDTNGLRPNDLGGDVYRSYASEDGFRPVYKLGNAAGLVDLTVAAR